MREFMNDYKKLLVEPRREFMKKHWLGCIAANVLLGTVGYGVTYMYYARQEQKHMNTEPELKNEF